jgi:polyisoprenoid-binding protein YceI
MESSKYPKAKFRGEVLNMESVNLTKNGEYPVNVTGALTIHGETNDIETTGTFTVKDGVISAFSTFEVFVADYKIDIPKIVRDNIARVVKIDVDIQYEELKS